METSDSECFESADEDFHSDDETQIERKQDAKRIISPNVVENTEKLNVTDDVRNTCFNKKEIVRTEENANKNRVNKDLDDSVSSQNVSPTECWEPGADYEIDKNAAEPKESKHDTKILETSENSTYTEKVNDKSTAKHQLPPAVFSCGFDLASSVTDRLSEKKSEVEKHVDDMPPPIAICWEPDVDNKRQPHKPQSTHVDLMKTKGDGDKNRNAESGSLTKENMDKQYERRRPEFGVPPARTTCWFPNANNAQQPFEPHPAYVELTKKNEAADTEKRILSTEQIQKPDENTEENMWEDYEDWGTFDAPTKQDKVHCTDKEENMWEDDEWEPVESQSHQQQQNTPKSNQSQIALEDKSSWGDWGSWGLSTMISTATSLTTQVSQGITNVLESGIGAPDPVELARINKLEKEKAKQTVTIASDKIVVDEKSSLGFGLGNLVQGVTKLVETTSNKTLDTLETIGKKTMEVLQENDPGLKKKRAFLTLDDNKPILSQVLREAKEKAEKENKELEKKHFTKKANYETLFDDHQGLVHLEALEMLSKQCDIKLQSLLESNSGTALNDMHETLDQVKELCELPEEDEEETVLTEDIREKLESAVAEINIKISYGKLLTTWDEVEDWLAKLNLNICSKNELHQQAIESLAKITALAVEQFHKTGELLLVKDHRSTADEADSLVQLTTTLTGLIGHVAAGFSERLNSIAIEGVEKQEINSLITNVFFEAANSSSYIQDAFQLLIPVLQVGAV